jgi:hypothetical protein
VGSNPIFHPTKKGCPERGSFVFYELVKLALTCEEKTKLILPQAEQAFLVDVNLRQDRHPSAAMMAIPSSTQPKKRVS